MKSNSPTYLPKPGYEVPCTRFPRITPQFDVTLTSLAEACAGYNAKCEDAKLSGRLHATYMVIQYDQVVCGVREN
jgi:hypothetical protein